MHVAGSLAALLALLGVAGCAGESDGGEDPISWSIVGDQLSSALLAVAGTEDDVWLVGGRPADSDRPLAFHYDGDSWTTVDPGVTGIDLWWATAMDDGSVFFGGSNGTIVVRDPAGSFETFDTPGSGTVFGIWGATGDDVWAVGGRAGGGGAFAWRFDGSSWTEVALDEDITTTATLFKVAGTSAQDVWMVGSRGIALHWNGSELTREDVVIDGAPSDATLFSVGVDSQRVIAVGGIGLNGIIFENDGTGWIDASPSRDLLRWRGVAVNEMGAYAVGEIGQMMSRGDDGTWRGVVTETTTEDFHAALIDTAGAVWVVGGKFESDPMRDGVVVYGGTHLPEVLP